MTPELYLIAPADADAQTFAPLLERLLANAEVAALLLPAGGRPRADYEAFIRRIAPIGQEAGCAVLVEGEPALVRRLAADGLHATGSVAEIKAAIGLLKPDFIVGAGPVATRHEAMSKGELGLDYILFGPLSGASSPADREMAEWWAEAMEIPGVFSDPGATAATADAVGCEFLALSESLWTAADPVALLAAIVDRLEHQA
jgi:thiamine-phosphate pyrophosphorylase